MATAATPALAQVNRPPSTPPVNGRYRTGDDIDPMKDERSGLIREVGCQAIWSLSSCKPGFGVDQLRDQSLENYWQSDGQLPHLVNIQFRRKMTIRDICIYTDFKLDESYTPSKISIRCGTHFNDLQEVELVEFSEPSGWVQIFLKDIRDRPIRTFMLQLAVLSNHQNGRDTHLRQIRIHSPVDNLPVAVFPGNFTSLAYVSIWLHQLVKGFRDKEGNPLPNAHLIGVFHRVCKLLNDGIKPIFVFDGGVPVLKRQTLAARRQRKLESLDKAEISRQKILSTYLQQQLQRQVKAALPPALRMQAQIEALSKTSPTVSPKKRKHVTSSQESLVSTEDSMRGDVKVDEDLQAFRDALIKKLEDDVDEVTPKNESDSDEDASQANAYHYGVDYSENFSIIQAPEFDTLPLETQHEILFEMTESRKMNSWGKFDKMPKDLHSFSNFQMDRLVKRRTLQKKIQSVQQEMGQRHIHVQNLDDLLKMDYNNFDDKDTEITGSKDDGFVLIKSSQTTSKEKDDPKPGTSAAKTTEVITIDDFMEDSSSGNESMTTCSTSTNNVCESGVVNSKKTEMIHNVKSTPSDEEDADIKLAIELSLRDMGRNETSKKMLNDKNENRNTSVVLTHSSKGKNADSTQEHESPLNIQPSQMSHCAKFLDTVGFHFPQSQPNSIPETDSERFKIPESPIPIIDSEQPANSAIKHENRNNSVSSSDDDFEDVEEVQTQTVSKFPNTVAIIDLDAIKKTAPGEVDIFADVFLEETKRDSDSSADERGNESIVCEVPHASSAASNDEKFEKKWYSDSDSDIEADLMKMVMKESAVIVHPTEKTKTPIDKTIFSSPSNDTNYISESTHSRVVTNSDATDTGSDNRPNRPVKMITAEYMQVQEQLNSKLGKLHSEMGQQERIATSISDQMQIETQELISLFGIPYVVSPTEAESQCAFLDRACLTEGTITDDSDVWLFGGQRVYKNFFSQGQKQVELYQAADIQRVLNLNREKLILLAIMIGSDYSDGIQGVGPVIALEILSEFASTKLESFEILVKFREWWEEIQTKPSELFSGSKLKEKIRKLKIRPGFPSKSVFDAFINPTIDTSTESFKWGNPDLDAIRSYTKQKFGWEQSKCDSLLLPVLKKRQCELDQSRQLTLDSYISFGKMPSLGGGKRKKGSKRIQTAVKRLKRVGVESHELNLSSCSSDSDSNVETEGKASSSTTQKQVTNRVVKGKKSRRPTGKKVDKTKNSDEKPQSTTSYGNPTPSSSSTIPNLTSASPKKSEVIPQRVQSETNKMKNKQKAIEIFKMKKKQ